MKFCISALSLVLSGTTTTSLLIPITTIHAFVNIPPAALVVPHHRYYTCSSASSRLYQSTNDDDDDGWYSDYNEFEYSNNYDSKSSNEQNDYNSRRFNNNLSRTNSRRPLGRRFSYSRDTSRDNSNVDEATVLDLLTQRTIARQSRDYDTADAIRQDLIKNYSVGINDKEMTWRTGVSESGSGQKYGGGGGRRPQQRRGSRDRDFGPNGHDYSLSPDAGPNSSQFSDSELHTLIAKRLQAKMSRQFDVADLIQTELIEGGVFIHDGIKEYRADGIPYGDFEGGRGRGPGRTSGSRNSRADYTKSPHSADAAAADGVSDELITAMVRERTKRKFSREFQKADAIRDGLRLKYNVIIDDRLKQWSIGGDFGEEHAMQRELADAFANRGYIKSRSSLPSEEEEMIQQLVNDRHGAKKDRDFETADAIRDELMERYDVTLHDKQKLWSVGGLFEEVEGRNGPKVPRGVYTRRGGGMLSEEDVEKIQELLRERYHAKRDRNYSVADEIRDFVMHTYNVKIDDRSSEWHVDTDEYALVGTHGLDEEDVTYIDDKLRERFACKSLGDYDAADAIREDLKEKFGIKIDDRAKEWSVIVEGEEESVATIASTGIDSAVTDGNEDDEEDKDETTTTDEMTIDDKLDDALEDMLNDFSDDFDNDKEDDDSDVTMENTEFHSEADNEEDEKEDNDDEAAETTTLMTEEELLGLTVPILKEKLKKVGLPVTGKKAELIARLLA